MELEEALQKIKDLEDEIADHNLQVTELEERETKLSERIEELESSVKDAIDEVSEGVKTLNNVI